MASNNFLAGQSPRIRITGHAHFHRPKLKGLGFRKLKERREGTEIHPSVIQTT